MAIHKVGDIFVISTKDFGWLPGCYDSKRAANYAFRFSVKTLQELQNEVNTRIDHRKRFITFEMLQNKRKTLKK